MDNATMSKELAKFNVTDAGIEELRATFMPLRVISPQDEEGYQKCREARLIVKNTRCEVEKRRKELKEDSLKWGRVVDGEAKRIAALLEPIEAHLESQEKIVDGEKERVRLEAAKKLQAMIEHRLTLLAQQGTSIPPSALSCMTEGAFQTELILAKQDYDLKQQKLEEEELARKKESDRLAKTKHQREFNRSISNGSYKYECLERVVNQLLSQFN